MKLQKLLLVLFIFTDLSGQSQTNQNIIKAIQKHFQEINTDTSLKKITLQEEEFLDHTPDGGAELTGFFRNNSLVKIFEGIGLSYGNRTREYYFRDDKLFFVFEKFESFIQTKNGLNHERVKTTFEGLYYFNKEKLVEEKTSGKRTFEDSLFTTVSELQSAARDYFKLLSKRRSSYSN